MTTELQRLIDAVLVERANDAKHRTEENYIGQTFWRMNDLCNYLIAHAADYALIEPGGRVLSAKEAAQSDERERLERAVVEAYRHADFLSKKGASKPFGTLEKAEIALTAHLVAHADDGATT